MACSNFLTGIVNFVTLVLSLPIIAVGIWLAKQHNTTCYHFLEWPVIIIGGIILVVSLVGMLGAWCNFYPLLVLYLIVMFFLIAFLFIFTIFAFVVTNAGSGDAVPGKGFQEYHLGNYSTWLQNQVDKASLWNKIQICLNDAKVCNKLDNEYPNSTQFDAASLTPVQVYTCFFLSDLPFLSPLVLCLDFSMKFEIELCGQQKELQPGTRSDFQNWN
jgi:hypothetical protein